MKSLVKALVLAGAMIAPSLAQAFPDRPVSLIIPYSAGASNDLLGRYVADSLGKLWGQPVVVENVPGAGAAIGIGQVAQSDPDGHTLLWASSTFSPTAASNPDLPFDFATDLTPINKVGEGELIMVSGPRVKINSIEELKKATESQTIFFAGTGPASIPTFMARLVGDQVGIHLEGVNYKGGSEAILDVIAGRADLYVGTITSTHSMLKDGTLFPVAMLGKERSALYPDVQTIVEAGYPEAAADIWWGVFGPKDMDAELVNKINADIAAVMADPKAQEMFAAQGAKPATLSPEEFKALVVAELDRWKGLVEKFDIKAE